jgi:triosephosphate isomerase (TIM)
MSNIQKRPVVWANLKMNCTVSDAVALVQGIRQETEGIDTVDIVIAPPFTALDACSKFFRSTAVKLAAQTMHWMPKGAFTGDISAAMVAEFCTHVIVGHSERRRYHGLTDANVCDTLKAAYAARLTPVLCIGETMEERTQGRTREVVCRQLQRGLFGISPDSLRQMFIAYEPVWAIGGTVSAAVEQIREVHDMIRGRALPEFCGGDVAEEIRILYGGAVNPGNAADLFNRETLPNVDGFLVGGASLVAKDFATIVRCVAGVC